MTICNTLLHAHVLFYSPLLQEQNNGQHTTPLPQPVKEWMLVFQCNADLQSGTDSQQDVNWTIAAQSYPNLEEALSFISRQCQAAGEHVFITSASPNSLEGSSCKCRLQSNSTTKLSTNHHYELFCQAQLIQESHTSFIVSDDFFTTSSVLQHQLA